MEIPNLSPNDARYWREVCNTPAGRHVLAEIVALSGVLGASFSPGDPHSTAYNEGLRRIGTYILATIQSVATGAYDYTTTLQILEQAMKYSASINKK